MKFTADELPAVAVEFCRELYKRDPDKAIEVVKQCLNAGDQEAWGILLKRRAEKDPGVMFTFPIGDARLVGLHFDHDKGVKLITGRMRLDRAKEYFERFMLSRCETKAEINIALRRFGKNGFTGTEAKQLKEEFAGWWPQRNRKKGKQGRRRSEYDQRVAVRDETGTCWVKAPAKPLTFTAGENANLDKAAAKHGWVEKLPGNFARRPPIKHEGQSGWGEHKTPKGKQPKPEGYRPVQRQPLVAGGLG
jgi:hypothetical protein